MRCYYQRYRLRNFALDSCLTILTGGLWLIWIFCREMRERRWYV